VDELTRDRRWTKGNMQHIWLLFFGRRIRFAHRMAFINGILSYLASPVWFVFLVLTSIEATRLTLWPIDYFPDPQNSMFPVWPEWHPHWAVAMILSTFFLLFFPKFLAVADVLLSGGRRQFGGFWKLLLSVFLELFVSMLLAPIRMLAHSRYVLEALFNVSLHWGGQNRTDETGWLQALISQAPGTLLAVGWAALALWLDPMFFYWSLPVALPLILAAPTSVLLSRVAIGRWLRERGLLLTPEEQRLIPLVSTGRAAPDPAGEHRGRAGAAQPHAIKRLRGGGDRSAPQPSAPGPGAPPPDRGAGYPAPVGATLPGAGAGHA